LTPVFQPVVQGSIMYKRGEVTQLCFTTLGAQISLVVLPFGGNERAKIQDMSSLSEVESTKLLRQAVVQNITGMSGFFHFTIGKVCITAGKLAH
jgi:hypothetical protein